jgi:hypothetical protein
MAKSLTSTINSAIKGTIDLEKFKKGKNLSAGVVFKEQGGYRYLKHFKIHSRFQEFLLVTLLF